VKVLQVLEATTGGTRRHLSDVVLNLDRDRFEVTVLCANLRDPGFMHDVEILRARGVDVRIVRMVREIHPLIDARALAQVRRHVRAGGYDVVHTHSSKAGILGRVAAYRAGVPAVVHTPHAFAFQMRTGVLRHLLYVLAERWAARLAGRIVCVCASEREEALRHRIAPPEKIVVIENAIDFTAFRARYDSVDREAARRAFDLGSDEIVVGMAARYTEQKGHDILVRAAARLPHSLPFRLLLPGSGRCKAAVQARIRRMGLAERCFVTEALDDPVPFYAAIDVFVMPSLWEGLPYSLLDVMAAGKPIVASGIGGIADTLEDERTGLLVPAGDTAALAEALARVLGEPGLSGRLGAAAHQAARRRHSLKDMIGKLEALYETMYDPLPVG